MLYQNYGFIFSHTLSPIAFPMSRGRNQGRELVLTEGPLAQLDKDQLEKLAAMKGGNDKPHSVYCMW